MSFPLSVVTVTIADSEALSSLGYIGDGELVGIITPSGWDAGDITLQAAPEENGTPVNLYGAGGDTEETIQAGASRHIHLSSPYRGLGWVKVRSGTSGSPVTQSGAVDVKLVVRKYRPH